MEIMDPKPKFPVTLLLGQFGLLGQEDLSEQNVAFYPVYTHMVGIKKTRNNLLGANC